MLLQVNKAKRVQRAPDGADTACAVPPLGWCLSGSEENVHILYRAVPALIIHLQEPVLRSCTPLPLCQAALVCHQASLLEAHRLQKKRGIMALVLGG